MTAIEIPSIESSFSSDESQNALPTVLVATGGSDGSSVALKRKTPEKKGSRGTTHTSYDPAMWPSQLKQFTQRNAGRRATLEVDGASIGALLQVVELPFIGADYDHRDGRVEIMLGDFAGSDRHFSRSIANVGSISVLRTPDARDNVLCVTYEGGQTLLTFRV